MNDIAAANQVKIRRIIPDQLLVATPYVSAVISKLNREPFYIKVVAGEHTEESAALGLTRISFVGTYEHITDFRIGGGLLDIGKVVHELREKFKAENSGWYPTMGKNRALAENIIGSGSMIYTGATDPGSIPADKLPLVESRWNGMGTGRPSEPGSGVKVGIVDTPVVASPFLTGAIRGSYSDMLRPGEATILAGHATFVAGLILSVAPGVTIDVRGILGKNGQSDSWEAAKAIVELGNRVDILNLSFGCITGDGQPPLALATAIDLIDPKTIIVAAAGNFDPKSAEKADIDGTKDVKIRLSASFPAALDNVIAVGSAQDGRLADYSPHGPWVDAYADGGTAEYPVESTFIRSGSFNGFATWQGTSFAAALVTGAIAAEMKPTDESAQRAWNVVKERDGLKELDVHDERNTSSPRTILTSVITPRRWFNQAYS